MTNIETYEKFLEAFANLRGKHIWIIEERPIYKRIIEPGGHDHLGPLPDRCYEVIDHFERQIRMLTIDAFNIHQLLRTKPYFSKEDAEWTLMLIEKNENKEEY